MPGEVRCPALEQHRSPMPKRALGARPSHRSHRPAPATRPACRIRRAARASRASRTARRDAGRAATAARTRARTGARASTPPSPMYAAACDPARAAHAPYASSVFAPRAGSWALRGPHCTPSSDRQLAASPNEVRTRSISANGVLAFERAQVRDQEREPAPLLEVGAGIRHLAVEPGGSCSSRADGDRRTPVPRPAAPRRRRLQPDHERGPVAVVGAARHPAHGEPARAARAPGRRAADPPEPGAVGRGCPVRGALEVTIGRSSTDCSLEQIGQF